MMGVTGNRVGWMSIVVAVGCGESTGSDAVEPSPIAAAGSGAEPTVDSGSAPASLDAGSSPESPAPSERADARPAAASEVDAGETVMAAPAGGASVDAGGESPPSETSEDAGGELLPAPMDAGAITGPWALGALLFSDDFESGSLDRWVSELEGPDVSSVRIIDGKLDIDVGAGATVWFRERLQTDVHVAYDVTMIDEGGPNDRVSDLNQYWMATDPFREEFFPRATERPDLYLYYVGMGGNGNTTTRFRRYLGDGEIPLLGEYTDADHLLRGNTEYHVEIACFGGATQFSVNGEVFFYHEDPDPLTEGHFGFRTTRNHETADNFQVHELVATSPGD